MMEKRAMLLRMKIFDGKFNKHTTIARTIAVLVASVIALPFTVRAQVVEATGGQVDTYVDESGVTWFAHIFTEEV